MTLTVENEEEDGIKGDQGLWMLLNQRLWHPTVMFSKDFLKSEKKNELNRAHTDTHIKYGLIAEIRKKILF